MYILFENTYEHCSNDKKCGQIDCYSSFKMVKSVIVSTETHLKKDTLIVSNF